MSKDTGAGSCLPRRKCYHRLSLFRQGQNHLGGKGDTQNLHSCCLCHLLVNQPSETAVLALLTGPSIQKILSPQIDLVFRVKEWSHSILFSYLFIMLPSPCLMLLLLSHCMPRHLFLALCVVFVVLLRHKMPPACNIRKWLPAFQGEKGKLQSEQPYV